MPLPDDVARLFDVAGIFPINYREFAPAGHAPGENCASQTSFLKTEAGMPADHDAPAETVN